MGQYTEIVVKFYYKKHNLSKIENDIIEMLFNPEYTLEVDESELPDHPFFKCYRWSSIGHCSSAYHHPKNCNSFIVTDHCCYVFSRSDLKVGDDEIEKFFDWFNTLNIGFDGDFIGYSIYEESKTPTIWHKSETK